MPRLSPSWNFSTRLRSYCHRSAGSRLLLRDCQRDHIVYGSDCRRGGFEWKLLDVSAQVLDACHLEQARTIRQTGERERVEKLVLRYGQGIPRMLVFRDADSRCFYPCRWYYAPAIC